VPETTSRKSAAPGRKQLSAKRNYPQTDANKRSGTSARETIGISSDQ
jgi:hypothetical protein